MSNSKYLNLNIKSNSVLLNRIGFIILFNLFYSSASFFYLPLGFAIRYVFVFSFIIVFLFVYHEKKKINYSILIFIISCGFSIIANDVPVIFNAYLRLVSFLIMLFLIGPLVISLKLARFRLKLFHTLNNINILFCVLSFLGLVTGLYMGETINPEHGTIRVDFTGLYNHSMTLGPMSSIAVITSLYYIYKTKSVKRKILNIIFSIFCFLSLVAAGSRISIVALILGCLYFIYKVYNGSKVKFISMILLISVVLISSFPLWEDKTTFLQEKIELRSNDLTAVNSRTLKWNQRLTEFNMSPIFGIGFSSIKTNLLDDFDENTGAVEPGSSWLAILSMMGLFGFIPLFYFFIKTFLFLFRNKRNLIYVVYLGSVFVFISLHMLAEGYIFATGAILFFYLWLLLGVIESYKINFIE